jgi:hypothetical protein
MYSIYSTPPSFALIININTVRLLNLPYLRPYWYLSPYLRPYLRPYLIQIRYDSRVKMKRISVSRVSLVVTTGCLLLLLSFKTQIRPALQLLYDSSAETSNDIPPNRAQIHTIIRVEGPKQGKDGSIQDEQSLQKESYLQDDPSLSSTRILLQGNTSSDKNKNKNKNNTATKDNKPIRVSELDEHQIKSENRTEKNQHESGHREDEDSFKSFKPASRQNSTQTITSFQYNGTNSFGACLMWMDDYNRLIEWIAYHYQVLPLRHLVIFRDPKSTLDPSPILDRWRPYMNITYWTDLRQFIYVPSISILSMLQHDPHAHYKKQQGMFNRNCLNHLKRYDWTWTFLSDTDEFLLLNKFAVPNSLEKMKQHGIIMDTLKTAQNSDNSNNNNHNRHKNETKFSFQSETQQRRWGNASKTCVTMMRQQYSSFESRKEVIEKGVPSFFDPYRFQTMRFRYHGKNSMIGKSIVDASRVSVNAYTVMSPHRVIRECGSAYGFKDDLMHVNHYLGSWDYFQRPNDNRGGTQKRYRTFIEKNEHVNASIRSTRADEIRPWLQGFVESFGEETSLSLLQGVGFPYNRTTALPTRN